MSTDRQHDAKSPRQIRLTVGGRRVVLLAAENKALGLNGLTDGERSVALLATEGLRDADIATRRGSSLRTVANQLSSVYKKLGISSREQLVSRLFGDVPDS